MLPLVQNCLRLLSGFLLMLLMMLMMCLLLLWLIGSGCLLGGLEIARGYLVMPSVVVLMVVLGLSETLYDWVGVIGVIGRSARLLEDVRQGATVGGRSVDDMVVSLVTRSGRDHVDLVACGTWPHLPEGLTAFRAWLMRYKATLVSIRRSWLYQDGCHGFGGAPLWAALVVILSSVHLLVQVICSVVLMPLLI